MQLKWMCNQLIWCDTSATQCIVTIVTNVRNAVLKSMQKENNFPSTLHFNYVSNATGLKDQKKKTKKFFSII
jgi:hypothetical protein